MGAQPSVRLVLGLGENGAEDVGVVGQKAAMLARLRSAGVGGLPTRRPFFSRPRARQGVVVSVR